MADKRQVKKSIRQLQRVKTWQLILLLILMGLLSATFLRLNNIGMIERRTAVFVADKNGDGNIMQSRLFDLQRYSADHMNADTGVIYLEDQYQRDTEKAIAKASTGNPTGNVNVQADKTCKSRHGGYSQAYVLCFRSELAKQATTVDEPERAELPNPTLYRHDFASPIWSPDFAGFSLLACGFIVVLIIARFASLALLRLLLRRHYHSI